MYFNCKIADLYIGVNYKYNYTLKVFQDYIVSSDIKPNFTVTVTDEMIEYENKFDTVHPPAFVENIAVFRSICNTLLLSYNGLLFHSSAVSYDNKGYLFSARSGTGKSTHTRLLTEYNSDISYINDDKPFIRYFEDENKFYVYGTPWKGKHGLGSNVKVPLKAICFLSRGEDNEIKKVDSFSVLTEVFSQTVKPSTENSVNSFTDTISKLMQCVDFYKLKCNMNNDAPITSFNGMIRSE